MCLKRVEKKKLLGRHKKVAKWLFCIHIQHFFGVVRNKHLLELIKRRSKVQEKNMSCERALNFDH